MIKRARWMTGLQRGLAGLVIASGLQACGADQTPQLPAYDAPKLQLSAELQQRYDSTCGICHGVAGTGAPAAGDMAEWQERGKQGIETLIDHAISGYRGMPPMGMCMDCSQQDLQMMIEYMTGLECE